MNAFYDGFNQIQKMLFSYHPKVLMLFKSAVHFMQNFIELMSDMSINEILLFQVLKEDAERVAHSPKDIKNKNKHRPIINV